MKATDKIAHAVFIEGAIALLRRALTDRLGARVEVDPTSDGTVASLFDVEGNELLTHRLWGAQLTLPLAAPAVEAPPVEAPAPPPCVHTWERIEGEERRYACVWCDTFVSASHTDYAAIDARHRRNALLVAPAAQAPAVDPLAPGHRVMRVGDLVIERRPNGAKRDWVVREINDKGPILQRDDRPDIFETVTWAHIDLDSADLWHLSSEHDEPAAEASRGDGRPVEAPASTALASDITGLSVGDVINLDGEHVEVITVDSLGFVWCAVGDDPARDEGALDWDDVQHITADVWSTHTQAVDPPSDDPPLRVLITHDQGADSLGARKGLHAWKIPGSGTRSGADCRPLVMFYTPAVDSPDIAKTLARFAKARRPVLDLGVIAGADLEAHGPWNVEIRKRWNEAFTAYSVEVREAPKPRAKATTKAKVSVESLSVELEVQTEKKPSKAKAPKLHRQTKEPDADGLAIRGQHTVLGFLDDQWTTLAIREPDVTAPAWKLHAKECSDKGVRVRLYDSAPRCVWDSLDGGEP